MSENVTLQCREWEQICNTLGKYCSHNEDTKKKLLPFCDPQKYSIGEKIMDIPLCFGKSVSDGHYAVVLEHNDSEYLIRMISKAIPELPKLILESLDLETYIIEETIMADDLKNKLKKVKQKNKQLKKLLDAKKEAEEAKSLMKDQKHIFVSIDIEAYEMDHSILLEIGWSMYDAKTNKFMDQHYITNNYRHLKNGKFVDDNKLKFNYGISVWCSLKQALQELRKDLDYAIQRNGGFVLVGHGLDSDIKYLEKQKFKWPTFDRGETEEFDKAACVAVLNTDTIYGASINNLHNPPSLGKTLALLDEETWDLHNAGNDAHYTLLLLMKLVA